MNQSTNRKQFEIMTHNTDDGLYAALAHAFGERLGDEAGAVRWVEVGAGSYRLVFFRARITYVQGGEEFDCMEVEVDG